MRIPILDRSKHGCYLDLTLQIIHDWRVMIGSEHCRNRLFVLRPHLPQLNRTGIPAFAGVRHIKHIADLHTVTARR